MSHERKKPPIKEEVYSQVYRSAKMSERPPHVGSLVLGRIARQHADGYGLTPEYTQQLVDASGVVYLRKTFARDESQGSQRSSLHILDEYPDSYVGITHVAGHHGLVSFIQASGLPSEQELIVHPADASHVRAQLDHVFAVPCPTLRLRLLDRLEALMEQDLFPRAYKSWTNEAFKIPLMALRTHLEELALMSQYAQMKHA